MCILDFLINTIDGFAGGEVLEDNLLLNYVRESNDHGPFNSWDRQPYVYRAVEDMADGGDANMGATARGGGATGAARAAPVLRISPETQVLRNNLIFNVNFNGPSCGSIGFDLDDESSQYVHIRYVGSTW